MSQGECMMWLICIVGGFLSGSVMYCWMIPKLFMDKDVCALSRDHNPGAANVFKFCGPVCGMVCLVLDLLKGYLPVKIACQHLDTGHILFALVLAAPVLGHAMAPFWHCGGGKCISTAFGVLLGLLSDNPVGILLAFLYILFSTIVKIKSHRMRSMITFVLFGIGSFLILSYRKEYAVALGCALISVIAICKHTKYFSETAEETEEVFGLKEGEERRRL